MSHAESLPNLTLQWVRLAYAIACVGVLSGCSASEPPKGTAPRIDRRYANAQWDTLWLRQSSDKLTPFEYPARIASNGRYVFVVDAALRRLIALRSSDGAVAWTRDRGDDGNPLFEDATALAIDVHGNVLLADSHQGYLVQVDSSGTKVRRMRLRGIPFVLSMCPLRDESVILHTLQSPPLKRFLMSTGDTAALLFPWKDGAEMEPLALQGLLSPTTEGDRCVLALGLGRGFATVGVDSAGKPQPYIETLDLPRVITNHSTKKNQRTDVASLAHRQIAAMGVSVAEHEITIPFGGETRAAGRIIDIYAERSGKYLRSLLYPQRVTDLVRVGSVYYSVDGPGGMILAAVPHVSRVSAKSP
jgi:hypothetical protein